MSLHTCPSSTGLYRYACIRWRGEDLADEIRCMAGLEAIVQYSQQSHGKCYGVRYQEFLLGTMHTPALTWKLLKVLPATATVPWVDFRSVRCEAMGSLSACEIRDDVGVAYY